MSWALSKGVGINKRISRGYDFFMSGYTEFAPDGDVAQAIAAVWMGEPAIVAEQAGTIHRRVLPDGCIDLIFEGGSAARARLFTSPLIESAAVIVPDPQSWFVGVRFHPGMSRMALDVDPRECRDREIPAREIDLDFTRIEERLLECRTPDRALERLLWEVNGRLRRNRRRASPARVQRALAFLACGRTGLSVQAVAHSLGMTERTLHRDLVAWTGLRPKLLARIFRVQRALRLIRSRRMPLITVAHEIGYSDQAHMTRDLQRVTGFGPSEIRAAAHV